jgi:hypothetical protein
VFVGIRQREANKETQMRDQKAVRIETAVRSVRTKMVYALTLSFLLLVGVALAAGGNSPDVKGEQPTEVRRSPESRPEVKPKEALRIRQPILNKR